MLRSFQVPVGHLYVVFGKMFIQVLCPFFKLFCFFFDVEFYEFYTF